MMRSLVEDHAGLDHFAGCLAINARSLVWITALMLDTNDEAESRHVYDTCKLLVREASKRGYGEFRAHIDLMDLTADQYSFGDHAYRRFCEQIKDAVDPKRHLGTRAIRYMATRTTCRWIVRESRPQEAGQPVSARSWFGTLCTQG
jgi:hypothetical protein